MVIFQSLYVYQRIRVNHIMVNSDWKCLMFMLNNNIQIKKEQETIINYRLIGVFLLRLSHGVPILSHSKNMVGHVEWNSNSQYPIVGAGGAQFDFRNVSHLQPLGSHLLRQPLAAATCCSHLGQVSASGCQVSASGCQVAAKWLPSGCLSKWLPSGCQVAASGCQVAALASGCQVAAWASGCQAAAWASGCQVAASGCQVAARASGCKWLPSGCKWLHVAGSGCLRLHSPNRGITCR